MSLLEPLTIGSRTAKNRVLFGPHETNLARGRALSARHVAYYAERARGGCGTIVVEEAAVISSDWPYERSPAASEASEGWRAIATSCHPEGALVIAAIGHSGGQGSSAYSQRELWGPSDEPEVNSREVPKVMEASDIDAVVAGFGAAARAAMAAGLDGVEINAGQHSLVRQFLSGLTNRRFDAYGEDRSLFPRQVLSEVRDQAGADAVVGLRFSADELAPWAGITPEAAIELARELAPLVDYLVVVRGGIFSVDATRPNGHRGAGVNLDIAVMMTEAVAGAVPVFAQGSIVDVDQAETAVTEGRCDGVEMTRAQIADPELVNRIMAGETPRPCVLCNQKCQVRDGRNPIITCVVEPRSGFETTDPPVPAVDPAGADDPDARLLVVGAGPAGLEAARVAARRGHGVTIIEAGDRPGGLLPTLAQLPGQHRFALLADWLVADAVDHGAELRLSELASPEMVDRWPGPVIVATGGRLEPLAVDSEADAPPTLDPVAVLAAATGDGLDGLVPATVAVWDPIGNATGAGIAELLAHRGRSVTLITPDAVAATLLSLTGDLAGANTRLQQAQVAIARRQRLIGLGAGLAIVEHAFTSVRSEISTEALIDCSGRLPLDELGVGAGRDPRRVRAGDAVAARTVAEAIREGRAAALALPVPGRAMTAAGAES